MTTQGDDAHDRDERDEKEVGVRKLTPVGFPDSPLAGEQMLWLCVLDHAVSVAGLAHHVPRPLDLSCELQNSSLPLLIGMFG